jgi:hypothetical protein
MMIGNCPVAVAYVCIHAQLKHGTSGAKTVCKFEVGLPLRTAKQKDRQPNLGAVQLY